MNKIFFLGLLLLFMNCKSNAQDNEMSMNETKEFEISKTEAEWKAELTPEEFKVLRKAGTERPFSSPLNNLKEEGTFVCAACATPLFKSEHKFDSGTGWPSFDREIEGNVAYSKDYNRIEEHCATCGGHLGHIFNDGPRETTGKRHCINGVALDFVPSEN